MVLEYLKDTTLSYSMSRRNKNRADKGESVAAVDEEKESTEVVMDGAPTDTTDEDFEKQMEAKAEEIEAKEETVETVEPKSADALLESFAAERASLKAKVQKAMMDDEEPDEVDVVRFTQLGVLVKHLNARKEKEDHDAKTEEINLRYKETADKAYALGLWGPDLGVPPSKWRKKLGQGGRRVAEPGSVKQPLFSALKSHEGEYKKNEEWHKLAIANGASDDSSSGTIRAALKAAAKKGLVDIETRTEAKEGGGEKEVFFFAYVGE